jgi:recombination protein RecA|tara:strand:- start:3406 stop:4395 length:990 start_codon:yes stop_codon:yes gene_type:complete
MANSSENSKKKVPEKKSPMDAFTASADKLFGKGKVFTGNSTVLDIERVSTGVAELNGIIGGGRPRGRIYEYVGHTSSGKTTTALLDVAEVQRNGGNALYVDMEHALNREWAEKLGVDFDKLSVSQPSHGDEALDLVELAVQNSTFDLIVVDSVATLVPKKELEAEMGTSTMGMHARLMSQALRKLTPKIDASNTAVIFINQYRQKMDGYGNPNIGTGGVALPYYASIRVEVAKGESIKVGENQIGNKVRLKVLKNKLAAPFKVAYYDLYYELGYVPEAGILDAAVDAGIIERSGSWFSYGDTRLGQGRTNIIELLRDNQEMLEEIKSKL